MTNARPILVATDLSAPARHAVERAFHLAARTKCELCILHAMELDTLDSLREILGDDLALVKAALDSDARKHLEQLAGDATIHRGVTARTRIAEGNPLATIAAEADVLDAHLVVPLHAFELPYEGKLTFAGLSAAEYSGRIVHGDPAQQIIALEQEVDSDLIVVGKHGTHIAEELLLGSVTKHVLDESQCDVLVFGDPHAAPDQLP